MKGLESTHLPHEKIQRNSTEHNFTSVNLAVYVIRHVLGVLTLTSCAQMARQHLLPIVPAMRSQPSLDQECIITNFTQVAGTTLQCALLARSQLRDMVPNWALIIMSLSF